MSNAAPFRGNKIRNVQRLHEAAFSTKSDACAALARTVSVVGRLIQTSYCQLNTRPEYGTSPPRSLWILQFMPGA